MDKPNFYELAGGHAGILRVVKDFYDIVFKHPILKGFFVEVTQEFQEQQFTDFMAQLLGGPKRYGGRPPNGAHTHLMITEEHYDLRHELLRKVLQASRLPEEVQQEWLRLDQSFRQMIVKRSVADCKPKYKTGRIIEVATPVQRKAS